MSSGTTVSDIYDEALPVVYGYVRRRCSSTELAEDITATAFVRAVSAKSRGHVDDLTTSWVISVARNLLVDHWRHRAVVERSASVLEDRVPTSDPWIEVLDAAHAEHLLNDLKPEHKCALILRYLDDLSVPEVAELMGRSIHATESLLVRARGALRRNYERSGGVQ